MLEFGKIRLTLGKRVRNSAAYFAHSDYYNYSEFILVENAIDKSMFKERYQ